MPCFQCTQQITFLIQQVGADIHRYMGYDPQGIVLHDVFFDDAQYRQRQRFHATNGSLAGAARANDLAGLAQ